MQICTREVFGMNCADGQERFWHTVELHRKDFWHGLWMCTGVFGMDCGCVQEFLAWTVGVYRPFLAWTVELNRRDFWHGLCVCARDFWHGLWKSTRQIFGMDCECVQETLWALTADLYRRDYRHEL